MDVLDLLAEDHDNVRELFRQFSGGGGLTGMVRRALGSMSPDEKLRAASDICNELQVHTEIEEGIFYPAVQALGDHDLDRQVRDALKEHGILKQVVAELRDPLAAGADLELLILVERLESDVEYHFSEEEGEMFPRVEKLMPDRMREDLGLLMLARKERMPRPAGAEATARHTPDP